MREIILDFSGIDEREELHAYLKKQFEFPDYYGENLDALYDCLTEIMEETEIIFREDAVSCFEGFWPTEVQSRSEGMEKYLRKTRRVIEDAAEENENLHL